MPFIGKQGANINANSKIKKYSFTVGSGGQTDFSVNIGSADEVQVFLNGVLLQDIVDYTQTSAQISLASASAENDILDVHVYQSFVLADAVTESTAKATAISSAIALGG